MSNQTIAVIVPVYNIEKYLPVCLDSILAQTYTALEIVLVDDGSTDSSGQICDKYAKRDKRVKVVHKENGGLPAARRDGLAAARSGLITFVDGDDAIHLKMIEVLVEAKQCFGAELSHCWFKRFLHDSELDDYMKMCDYQAEIMTPGRALEGLLYHQKVIPSQWGKLYDRDLFDGEKFPIQNYDEDFAMTYKLITKAKMGIAVTNFPGYFYRDTVSGMSRQKFSVDKMVGLDISERLLKLARSKFPKCVRAAKYRIFAESIFLLTKIDEPSKFTAQESRLFRAINKYKLSVVFNRRAPRRDRKLAAAATMIGARKVARILQRKAT